MNPFKYGQIVKESNFCQRPNLTKKLTNNIKQSQNVYIQGERRTGKSSLICEAVRKLKKYRMLYIDLLEVKSIDDLIKRMVTAIISMESAAGFVEKTFKALSQLRPVASIDPISGMPTLAIDASTTDFQSVSKSRWVGEPAQVRRSAGAICNRPSMDTTKRGDGVSGGRQETA